jgi:hypothetical protein
VAGGGDGSELISASGAWAVLAHTAYSGVRVVRSADGQVHDRDAVQFIRGPLECYEPP